MQAGRRQLATSLSCMTATWVVPLVPLVLAAHVHAVQHVARGQLWRHYC
jgi:hypothetical protein